MRQRQQVQQQRQVRQLRRGVTQLQAGVPRPRRAEEDTLLLAVQRQWLQYPCLLHRHHSCCSQPCMCSTLLKPTWQCNSHLLQHPLNPRGPPPQQQCPSRRSPLSPQCLSRRSPLPLQCHSRRSRQLG